MMHPLLWLLDLGPLAALIVGIVVLVLFTLSARRHARAWQKHASFFAAERNFWRDKAIICEQQAAFWQRKAKIYQREIAARDDHRVLN